MNEPNELNYKNVTARGLRYAKKIEPLSVVEHEKPSSRKKLSAGFKNNVLADITP